MCLSLPPDSEITGLWTHPSLLYLVSWNQSHALLLAQQTLYQLNQPVVNNPEKLPISYMEMRENGFVFYLVSTELMKRRNAKLKIQWYEELEAFIL